MRNSRSNSVSPKVPKSKHTYNPNECRQMMPSVGTLKNQPNKNSKNILL